MRYLHECLVTRMIAATSATLLMCAASAGAATDACSQTTPLTGGTLYTTDGTGSEAGDGNHELWHDGGGTMKMTVYGKNAAFKAEWNNAGDFLARTGLKWNETKTYDAYGNVTADFNFTKSGTGGGYSYIGIYGWSNTPLVEYYIVENGFWTTPPNAGALGGATSKGSFDVDGGTYDIYTYQRVNKPSIHGNATFMQFWSVRRTPRTCGHISISEHWKKWASLGMTLGKMYEAKILVEAGGGQGSFDLSYATVQANVATVSIAPNAPKVVRNDEGVTLGNGKSGTVSLVSLDGTVIRSVRQSAASPAVVPTSHLSKGVYLLRFQGEDGHPEVQKLLVE